MKIDQDYPSCRYWAYEVAASHKEPARRKKAAAIVKGAGFKPSKWGFRSKVLAIAAAEKIETVTGVEMRILNHDYI